MNTTDFNMHGKLIKELISTLVKQSPGLIAALASTATVAIDNNSIYHNSYQWQQ